MMIGQTEKITGFHDCASVQSVNHKTINLGRFLRVFSYQLPAAAQAVERITKLYEVEKQARFKSPQERVALRQKHAKPIFDDLEIPLPTNYTLDIVVRGEIRYNEEMMTKDN